MHTPFTRRRTLAGLAVWLMLVTRAGADTTTAAAGTIDWPAFLAQHDMVWHRLPRAWREGAPLGNGRVGAMVYATSDTTLTWVLGRTDVYDHRAVYDEQGAPALDPSLARARLPIGEMDIVFPAPVRATDLRLDLWNAALRGSVTLTTGAVIAIDTYVHTDRPVIVIDLGGPAASSTAVVRFRPAVAINERKLARRMPLVEDDLNPAPVTTRYGDVTTSTQARRSGGDWAVAWRTDATPERRLVLVSIDDSHPEAGAGPSAARAVDEAWATGRDALRRTHRAWWHAYYPASFVTVPDARLEAFYWIQMYKLASATRADALVIDNQGPWYQRTPWPNAWWNLNVQLSYWPVYTANRLALGESLLRFVDDHRETLQQNVPAAQRRDGIYGIGRMSAPDGVSPMDVSGPWSPDNGAFELSNLVWVMHNYWRHWRHEGDDARLPALFTTLRGAVGYLLLRLDEGADGRLHLPQAISPEYPGTAADTAYDLALLRWGCATLLQLDDRRGGAHPDRGQWQDVLARLAPYPVDANGYMVGRDVPFAESHRHFSHLLMVYPLRMVTGRTPDERALIERSLAHWIGFEGALQGYSFVGASAISSLLGNGDDARRYLDALITRFVLPNTMYTESGPVMETPLAAAQALHEMLLQGWDDTIHVFPAMPAAWPDAAFDQLRTEGAFLVSARRTAGRTTAVHVTSLTGTPVTVHADIAQPQVVGRASAVRRAGAGVWAFTLEAGERVAIVDAGVGEAARGIAPVRAPRGGTTRFGLPREDSQEQRSNAGR